MDTSGTAIPGTSPKPIKEVLSKFASETLRMELPPEYEVAVIEDVDGFTHAVSNSGTLPPDLMRRFAELTFNLQHGCLRAGESVEYRNVLRLIISRMRNAPAWLKQLGESLSPLSGGDRPDEPSFNSSIR